MTLIPENPTKPKPYTFKIKLTAWEKYVLDRAAERLQFTTNQLVQQAIQEKVKELDGKLTVKPEASLRGYRNNWPRSRKT